MSENKFTEDLAVTIPKNRLLVRGSLITGCNCDERYLEEMKFLMFFAHQMQSGEWVFISITYYAKEVKTKHNDVYWPYVYITITGDEEEFRSKTVLSLCEGPFTTTSSDVAIFRRGGWGKEDREISPANPVVYSHLMAMYALLGAAEEIKGLEPCVKEVLHRRFNAFLGKQKRVWQKLL